MSEEMIFCLGDGRHQKEGEGYQKNNRVFNKKVDNFNEIKTQYNKIGINLPITEGKDKTDIVRLYKKAWKEWWNDNPSKHQAIKDLPHFDPRIFKEITGIDARGRDDTVECIIDGKKLQLSRKSIEELKKLS